jgi:hypothetical protein
MKDKLLFVTTLPLFTQASLRGPSRRLDSWRLPQNSSPQNKDVKQLQKLKRVNEERKRKNAQKKSGVSGDTKRDEGEEKWSTLSKEEKKNLIKELKKEEKDTLGNNQNENDKEQKEGGGTQVNPNQLAYLQQYFHHLDDGMEMNSDPVDDADVRWSDLTKEEKKRIKEYMNGELQLQEGTAPNNDVGYDEGIVPNSSQSTGQVPHDESDGSSNEADGFVIYNRPKPGTLTVEDILNFNSPNDESEGNDKDEGDMTSNSQQASSNEADGFVLPMPTLTFGDKEKEEDMTASNAFISIDNAGKEEDEDSTSSSNAFVSSDTIVPNSAQADNDASANNACPNCYTFASQLIDPSIQLDSFDPSSNLDWSMAGLGWTTISQDCFEGTSCLESGITSELDHKGEPVSSDLTLRLGDDFEGGVLTFQVHVKDGLRMPNEAFYVSVDDEVKLSPLSFDPDWKEYSVSVGRGAHSVRWSHVYNPLGLEALPAGNIGGLVIDDLRYSPFGRILDQGFEDDKASFVMTSDGDAVWKVDDKASNSGHYSIVASTKNINQESGSSNVNFVLYSEEGGTLKYKIASSTTAPHDDFVILLNDEPVDSVFGLMPTFEYKSLDIPAGKVAVTLQHRKNPGELSQGVLDVLGAVRTKGFTRLDDVRFEPK